MQSDIALLLKLQVIDYDLGELERSKEYLPDMMGNLTREVDEARTKLAEYTLEKEQALTRQKALELEIKSKEESLEKYQRQMMTIKTNKEYDALVSEIDALKGDINLREQELMTAMERLEELDNDLPSSQGQLDQIQENNARQLQVLQEKIDSIGDTVAKKVAERQQALNQIPRPTMSIYERVRKGLGGAVVITVKKRSCSACHKALTPKKVQEIRRADKIHTCDSCGRLLYWDNDISN